MIPSLPQHDLDSKRRELDLRAHRALYHYDYAMIPGVAMLRPIPAVEYPSAEWTRIVGRCILDFMHNELLVGRRFARRSHGVFGPAWVAWRWASSRLRKAVELVPFVGDALAKRRPAAHQAMLLDRLSHELARDQPTLRMLQIAPIDGYDDSTVVGQILNDVALDEPRGSATHLSEFADLFQSISLPRIAKHVHEDRVFARLRVAGPNPMAITGVDPGWESTFPVPERAFRSVPGFEADSFAAAMAEARLYMVDYKRLESVVAGINGDRQKYSYAPKALFAVPKDPTRGRLLPIAIQCQQTPQADALFTPDAGIGWEMAKTVVNVADTNQHGFVAHLAHTHLLIEAFLIATARQLSARHPLHRLLTPHFEATAFINWAAAEVLLANAASVDELFSGTLDASKGVAATAMKDSFNALMLPRDLASRKVLSPVLDYPYRDDAIALWAAIRGWVEGYLHLYYASDSDVLADHELSAWTAELVSHEGGRLQGFGDHESGQISTRQYLVDAATMIIFTASVQHAAVNFPQASIMAYAPLLPMGAYAPAPQSSRRYSEADWLRMFPPLETARKQLRELYVLGSVWYKRLGDYDAGHFADPRVASHLSDFRASLRSIERKIDDRSDADERERHFAYRTLRPSAIPVSTSI